MEYNLEPLNFTGNNLQLKEKNNDSIIIQEICFKKNEKNDLYYEVF